MVENNENIEKIIITAEGVGCDVMRDEPLCEHTTFRVGGPCRAMIEINSEDSLCKLTALAKKLDVYSMTIGKGSNMLFDDKGFDGVIFLLGNCFAEISLIDETTVYAQAGAGLSRLCTFALENSLGGLEFAYGIPGTVGGGIYMNAGAYGGEIRDVIKSARAVNSKGEIVTLTKDEMDLSYRHSAFMSKDMIVLSAEFSLAKTNACEIKSKMQDLIGRRKDKQPLEYPSAGSTFKRPEGQFAGKLIQKCGLKGFSVGGAEVSQKHSGFVINKANATCEDIKKLISVVQKKVLEDTGFFLECEVRIIPYSRQA